MRRGCLVVQLERHLDGIAVHRRPDVDEPPTFLERAFDPGSRELVRSPRRVAPLEIELAVPGVDDHLRPGDVHAAILTEFGLPHPCTVAPRLPCRRDRAPLRDRLALPPQGADELAVLRA